MKFGQVIEYNKNIFLYRSCRQWGRETSSRPLFVFWKSFIWGKSKWSAALFQSLSIVINLANNKNKIYKTLQFWSRDMLNFDFLEKGLEIVSPSHFVYDFSRKMFLKLYSTKWPGFFIWFHYFFRYCWIYKKKMLNVLVFFLVSLEQLYCNCLLTGLWHHSFWNYSYLSNQPVFLQDQSFKTKI